jgi:hypothetical protein
VYVAGAADPGNQRNADLGTSAIVVNAAPWIWRQKRQWQ